ncbi:hypothetical protein [Mycolicibacterium mageritense]|uniref:hypothetical protein n=1 Tax=Mycolicibacterium mageritense TaxID=53462 RepID=UPI001E4A4D14|nr:hypothetical protein [Mycolicibacterium mageritense]MCC9186675.1 hypothetical protein [Mycolicibacterium mageritense]
MGQHHGSTRAETGQLTLDFDRDLEMVSLAETTFVVVDLETTGGRATASQPGAA